MRNLAITVRSGRNQYNLILVEESKKYQTVSFHSCVVATSLK